MDRFFSRELSQEATFSLRTGRLLISFSMPIVLFARLTDPDPSTLTWFSDLLAWMIGISAVSLLVTSFFFEKVAQNLYYLVMGVFGMHALDSFYNLYRYNFSYEGQLGLLFFTIVFIWYLRSRAHLLLFQVGLVSGLILVYFLSPINAQAALKFVYAYAILQVVLFILIGSRIGKIEALFQQKIAHNQLLDAMHEAVLQVDTNGNIMMVNRQFSEMLGYEKDELVGKFGINALIPEEDKPMVYQKMAARKAGQADRYEFRMAHRDGHILWLQVSAAPYYGLKGEHLGSVSILVDITERKRAEKERDTFSHQLSEVHHELALKNEELEQFAQVASQDLRLPIDEIDEAEKEIRSQAPAPARRIARRVTQMRDMLDSLLTYSISGARHMQLQPVDLNKVLDEVQQSMLSGPEAPDMRVVSGTMPTLDLDRLQMLRLFRGLMDHALRYRGAEVPTFRFSVSQEPGKGAYIFTMVDNGQGIDEGDIQRIFRIFRKDLMLEQDKVSMGLALCKKIVTNHGGRFWLTSNAGKGTSYFFTLPFRQEKGASPVEDKQVTQV